MSFQNIKSSGSEECKVCHQPAHGVHFGVVSCRACAAFFRRSVVMNKKYSCRRAVGRCTFQQFPFCRFCRLKKCQTLGMTEDNVQLNRDTGKSFTTETPGMKICQKPIFDITSMLKIVAENLKTFQLPNDEMYASKNSLERMEYALQIHRKFQKKDGLQFLSLLNSKDFVSGWTIQANHVSSWMMHSEEFRQLEIDDKLAVLNQVWMVWLRLERLTMTLDVFGQQAVDKRIILMSDTHAIYMNRIKVDVSMISDHDSDRVLEMFDPLSQKMFDEIARPLLDLEPSSIEVAYMLCQVVWHDSGKKLQGAILSAGFG